MRVRIEVNIKAIGKKILKYFLADQPDPLRVPEVIIIICVLLLWCGSIFIFIRHSELLRIRHRDLPYRSYMKPPMNLNHITVVRRTSDMVIHSKPRFSAGIGLTSTGYNHNINEYQNSETMLPSHRYLSRKERQMNSFDSNVSVPKSSHHDEQFLDPYMISSDIQRSLLDLHRKSMDNISTARYSMSFSTNDVSTCKQNDEQQSTVDERCIQESPV
jgi:hypothetical protein